MKADYLADPAVREEVLEHFLVLSQLRQKVSAKKLPATVSVGVPDLKALEYALSVLELMQTDVRFQEDEQKKAHLLALWIHEWEKLSASDRLLIQRFPFDPVKEPTAGTVFGRMFAERVWAKHEKQWKKGARK